ncbi:MAG: phosphate acetyltransferase, partial [Muribaculaceae bacterium]|nr:phosphate acetyltransferase [Muribaculaceae bacterium]
MSLFARLTARAKDNLRKIVLPEGDETRNLTAADQILSDNVAEIILLGDPEPIMANSAGLGL